MDNILSLKGPKDLQKTFANALKTLRLSKGLTQKTLASRSGVPEPTLKRFEHSGEISFASLLKVAEGLGILAAFNSVLEAAKPQLTAEEVRYLAKKKARSRGSK